MDETPGELIKQLKRELALMKERYEKALKDQEILLRELERLREENEKLRKERSNK
ncbi:hypothetical protein [Thermococcus barophilus]|uniref:Uncharacterized protein n=1 Tax=Thermococcus barophilus (strain DSM 11836 / MP) TaxID=391623 RepID=F0LJH5_THEBM|nr:hypothetical protein [Thermococcus barophilus]ADT83441.1 hypothetical protein TERMP_00464 [Thermococcus barophilus MP]